jgi:hypothetical protein
MPTRVVHRANARFAAGVERSSWAHGSAVQPARTAAAGPRPERARGDFILRLWFVRKAPR